MHFCNWKKNFMDIFRERADNSFRAESSLGMRRRQLSDNLCLVALPSLFASDLWILRKQGRRGWCSLVAEDGIATATHSGRQIYLFPVVLLVARDSWIEINSHQTLAGTRSTDVRQLVKDQCWSVCCSVVAWDRTPRSETAEQKCIRSRWWCSWL